MTPQDQVRAHLTANINLPGNFYMQQSAAFSFDEPNVCAQLAMERFNNQLNAYGQPVNSVRYKKIGSCTGCNAQWETTDEIVKCAYCGRNNK